MKSIGIVTYYNAINCGAFLQALALQMYLEREGFKPYIVDTGVNFLPPIFEDSHNTTWWQHNAATIQNARRIFKISQNRKYDAIVYGSDQIWNLVEHSQNPIFWGYHLQAEKKISYATCSTWLRADTLVKNPCKTLMAAWGLIHNFQAISVRDTRTKKIVKLLSLRNAKECLDPTFLVDFSQYKGENKRGKYIVVYTFGLQPENIAEIKKFAASKNCKIIYAGSYCDWADENPILNPFEWLNLIYHAAYVFTNTFHGCVFSLIFHKEF